MERPRLIVRSSRHGCALKRQGDFQRRTVDLVRESDVPGGRLNLDDVGHLKNSAKNPPQKGRSPRVTQGEENRGTRTPPCRNCLTVPALFGNVTERYVTP